MSPVEPITPVMEFDHRCAFCGWTRVSATPVMLSPACEGCGCALDAVEAAPATRTVEPMTLPAFATVTLRGFGVLIALLGLYAAAKVGFELAGASGALIAFGTGGFLLLPFVPERIS